MQSSNSSLGSLRVFIRLLAIILIVIIQDQRRVKSLRTRVDRVEETPSLSQIHVFYRIVYFGSNHFHLKQAGLLKEADISDAYRDTFTPAKGPRRGFGRSQSSDNKYQFQFNSGDFLFKSLAAKWFLTLEERTSMHVYDDPEEMKLASGPQVDQSLCGLHLDYMRHMVEKHQKNIMQSSEYSIFHLMNAFGSPQLGLNRGNTIFAGDYETCVGNHLNVLRDELYKVDRRGAESYFESARNYPRDGRPEGRIKRFIRTVLGPFVNLRAFDSTKARLVDSAAAKSKFRLLPMRYCFAGLRWPNWPNSSWAKRNIALRVATCLPETCDSSSLALYRQKIKDLIDFNMNKYQSGYNIENLYCLPDEQSPYRDPKQFTSTKLFIAFNVIWISLLIVATLVHGLKIRSRSSLKTKPRHRDRGMIANQESSSWWWDTLKYWSVIKNLRDFFAERTTTTTTIDGPKQTPASDGNKDRNKVNLKPLEGLKALGCYAVITSHSIMLYLPASWNFEASDRILSRTWLSMIVTVCPSVVNIFFVVTGLVTAKTLLQSPTRNQLASVKFWLSFFAYRYVRIIPLYLLDHWFLQSTFRFLGSGPFWDYGTSHSAWSHGCQKESFWTVLLPHANFLSPSIHCAGTGWYLANDLQFTLLTPFYLLLLWKRPLLGHFMVALTTLIGILNHIRYYFDQEPDPRGLLEFNCLIMSRITDDTMPGYVNPQFRFMPYLFGLSAGQLLDKWERNEIKQWPSWLTRHGRWCMYLIFYLIALLPAISSLFLDLSPFAVRLVASVVVGTAQSLSSLAITILILLLTSGHLQGLANFLSARLFKLVATMSLSTVLVHVALLFYHEQSIRSLFHASEHEFFKTNTYWFLESLALAFVVHILYEMPLRRLFVNLLLRRRKSGSGAGAGAGALAERGRSGGTSTANNLATANTVDESRERPAAAVGQGAGRSRPASKGGRALIEQKKAQ